jgi:5-methylthioadenosine/S-adenosylhomocysteine deaminase
MPCKRAWSWVACLGLLAVAGCPTDDNHGGELPDLSAEVDAAVDMAPPADMSLPPPVLTPGAADRLLLRGTLLTPEGPLLGELLIEGTRISCVAASCSGQAAAQGATVISTAGIILPGLLDAHNHGLFNIFDEQDWNPGRFFSNHNSWTSETRYKQVVDAKQYLNSEGTSPVDFRCEIDKYAEIKALIAGTTSFMLAPGAVGLSCYQSLGRTIDTQQNDLGQDLLRTSISVPDQSTAQTICNAFDAGTTNAYVVHVGEGIDNTARNEFTTLEGRANGCLLAPQTAIVHGTAFGTAEFSKMAAARMKLVWSPKSNLFLYNDTTRIDLAVQAGVERIALAPDWALGGSINMLDELRVAHELSQGRFGGLLSPRRLFEMVTIEPARVLGVDALLGSLAVGKRADVVLLRGDPSRPYEALIQARPATIDLVMVDGRVLYGDAALKAAGPAAPGCEDLAICNAPKFLCVAEPSAANKLGQTFADIQSALVSGLTSYDAMVAPGIPAFSPIAPLLKCP